ncbi:MAG: hypothetical protein ACTS6A_00770 [Candidatus Hodgkinia cicadicola]
METNVIFTCNGLYSHAYLNLKFTNKSNQLKNCSLVKQPSRYRKILFRSTTAVALKVSDNAFPDERKRYIKLNKFLLDKILLINYIVTQINEPSRKWWQQSQNQSH